MDALTRRLTPSGRQRHRENRAREREETVRFLRGPGCAVCRARWEASGYWVTAYINETHGDADVVARVRRSLGLCPAHTRVLLADVSASWITPSLFQDALAYGLELLPDGGPPPLGCPACANVARAEESACARIVRNVGEQAVRDAYAEVGGLCLPHAAGLARRLPVAYADLVSATALARLDGEPTTTALAGADADARARAALIRSGLPAEEDAAPAISLNALLRRDLRAGCCPVCRRGARTAYRYLAWLIAGEGSAGPVAEDAAVCGRHLHDLEQMDAAASDWVRDCVRARWRNRFERFRAGCAAIPAGRFPRAGTAYRRLTEVLNSLPACRACEAERGAVRRAEREIGIAVRDDRLNAALGRAHGVCVRHALSWGADGAGRVREVTAARAAAMAFELGELLRKNSWSTRFEAHGAEMSAEFRAPTVLDGRIYGGLRAAEAEFGDVLPDVRRSGETRRRRATAAGPSGDQRPAEVRQDAAAARDGDR